MSKDPMYLTTCDRCGRGTWFPDEGPCRMSYPARCPTCHQTTDRQEPCPGTRRLVDRSGLVPRFAAYFESGERIRVRWPGGDELTGTVGKTTGWRPSYLLMLRSDSTGSPWLLGPDAVVVAVKRGSRYVPTYQA